jgi:hypothetical protein
VWVAYTPYINATKLVNKKLLGFQYSLAEYAKMKDWKKVIDRMVRRGELIVESEENGKKVYKRPQTTDKNDFLIDGVLASTLPKSQVREVLDKWYEEGNADIEMVD